MNVREAKELATDWVAESAPGLEGLRAAHLVGSITSMADGAEFPPYKDVDLHLVFDDDSPALRPTGPFANILETEFHGLLIEGGLKPVSDYANAATVLANPEIAHHLTLQPILFDPDSILARLQPEVRRRYASPGWVEARLDHERSGLERALSLLDMARATYGASGELNLLGYSFTFAGAKLDVALLRAPSTGSGFPLRMESALAAEGRPELYEEFLAVMGVARLTPADVERALTLASEEFDAALPLVSGAPHPFQHKLKAHLRPYFVDSCRALIDIGRHREAANWISPYFASCTDVIRASGDQRLRARFEPLFDAYLDLLGKGTAMERALHVERAIRLHAEIDGVASGIADRIGASGAAVA